VRLLSATRLAIGFEHEADARRFWEAMRKRLEEFSLSLHPDKTRLIEFGRHAAEWVGKAGNLQVPGLRVHLWADAQGQDKRSDEPQVNWVFRLERPR
jgi:hypothetical protein